MSRVCVATSSSKAYFSLVTRLRAAGLPFSSVVPGAPDPGCDVVLTTREEAAAYGPRSMAFEDLDESPYVLKGQVLSRLDGGAETLLVGVDPGVRIGMAAFYGSARLEFATFESVDGLCGAVSSFAAKVPAAKSLVRVGSGDQAMAGRMALALAAVLPGTAIEMVDEAGTSSRGRMMRGVQGDQMAAARIAFRRGIPLEAGPRTRPTGPEAGRG